jgi:hypothetical protein
LTLKVTYSEFSGPLFELRQSEERVGFHDIVINDEFLFLQLYRHGSAWFIFVDKAPTKVRHAISVRKTMLAMLLSIRRAILIY